MRAVLLLLLLAGPVAAQSTFKLPGAGGTGAKSFTDVATVTVTVDPPAAKPGQVVKVKVTVAPKPGCWTYPVETLEHQDSKNSITAPKNKVVVFVSELTDPPGWKEKPSVDKPGKMDRYYPGPTTWELTAVVSPSAPPGKQSVILSGTQVQACNDSACFNSDRRNPPAFDVEVLPGPAEPVPAQYAALVNAPAVASPPAIPVRGSTVVTPPPAPPKDHSSAPLIPADRNHAADLEELASRIDATPVAVEGGFLGLLLAAVFWGFVSLATPCVFPMIPITVSLFLKHGNQTTGGAVRLALVYCLTIIVVLGASAVFLLSIFRQLSNSAGMNIFLGGLFVVFALSLFGMYDISLPGFLLRATERRRGAGGMIGTVFGAMAFSIVSFTCVAPFLGGFAGLAASGQFSQWQLILAGIAFAAAFATPFFLLALFPSLLKKLPKSGGWLDTVKAVMGFLELAAAFKFLRSAELLLSPQANYFTYDLVLGAWVAISAAAGLYMLNLYRLPHDDHKPATISVPQLLIGLGFLGFAVYLTPALFKSNGESQRPGGAIYAWVDAFLLPEPSNNRESELAWSADLKGAVDRIVKEKQAGGTAAKPFILIDFTGVNCTNCKLNEKNIFPQPKVKDLLQRYTLVAMYTDQVPATLYATSPDLAGRQGDADHNLAFQRKLFGTEQLPLYVILEPLASGQIKVLGVYDEGKINDVAKFIAFLEAPLQVK